MLRVIRIVSWLAGLTALCWLILFFGWNDTTSLLRGIGLYPVLVWIIITITSRVVLIEALVRPLLKLGAPVSRWESFWLGWARSFFNQIVPMAGAAYMAGYLRSRTTLPWSAMAAIGSPQVLFAAIAMGLCGAASTFWNWGNLGESAWMILALFFAFSACPLGLALSSGTLLARLPFRIKTYFSNFRSALLVLHGSGALIAMLVGVHACAILLRATRLWMLFLVSGVPVEWTAILLISCIGELVLILQITPGGIGLREGTLIGAGILLGMEPKTVAGIAIIDRLLMLGVTIAMAPLAFLQLSRAHQENRTGTSE